MSMSSVIHYAPWGGADYAMDLIFLLVHFYFGVAVSKLRLLVLPTRPRLKLREPVRGKWRC